MGVCGYLTSRVIEFRMDGGEDSCGIRWDGAVVEGRQGLVLRMTEQRRDAIERPLICEQALCGLERRAGRSGT